MIQQSSKGRETQTENQLVIQFGGCATGQSPVPRKRKLQLFRSCGLLRLMAWRRVNERALVCVNVNVNANVCEQYGHTNVVWCCV